MHEQRPVASLTSAEVVDEQIGRRQDRGKQPEDEPHREDGDDDEEDQDRERRADQEPEQDHACDLDPAQPLGGHETDQRGLLLELVGGGEGARPGGGFFVQLFWFGAGLGGRGGGGGPGGSAGGGG